MEVWAGLKGMPRFPASSKSGELLRLGGRQGRRERAVLLKCRQAWKLRRRAHGASVHAEHRLCQDPYLTRSLRLPLGETDRKSEGRGACMVWSAELSLRSRFVVGVKAAVREKPAARETHTHGVAPVR